MSTPPERLTADITTFVGREQEVAEVRRLLDTTSVVTLTGPGGVGKTRLASRVAASVADRFPDGVLFLPLADLSDRALLASTAADVVGLADRATPSPIDLVVGELRDRAVLLVIDNCEHVVDECAAFVETLVRTCPRLVILSTSRQSLGVEGERILPVRPLRTPPIGEPAEQLRQYDAVRLFVDRATAVVPGFEITADNAADVVDLCRQLDGLPLAIELAAVRLRALSVRQVVERLDRQLALLKGGPARRFGLRHETLRGLMDWSYELCSDEERLMWARLSVFTGSVFLDAAEAVCAGAGLAAEEVLDVIEGLVDKSVLLRVEHGGVVRFRMLETVRQYGQDKLAESDDHVAWQRRHRDFYADLTARFAAEWLGPDQAAWIARLGREHHNLRLALDFCTRDPEEAVIGMAMAHAFKEYWLVRGFNTEGRIQISKLLEAAAPHAPGRAQLMWSYAFLALVQGDQPAYEVAVAEARQLAEAVGDAQAAAYVRHVEGYRALLANDMAVAVACFSSAVADFRAVGDVAGELWSTYNHGIALAIGGDLDLGRTILRDCIATYAELGEWSWRSWALWSLAAAECLAGDLTAARTCCEDVLRQQVILRDRAVIAFVLTVLAGVEARSCHDRRAARLLGAAATVWRSVGTSPRRYGAFVPELERDTAEVTGRLGWDTAEAEFAAGAQLSLADALDYALCGGDEEDDPDDQSAATISSPLTAREQQVADLVAQGMTNRGIAETLVIARRTAETHVEHILAKLGFSNRSQIATWVTERRGAAESPA
ncbi:LuxR family transcriptional regulator [Nocardioides humilatus]|uniref:LuxR family transcriptional regulator n=1 Tax=Nocardioides humilatus TaxID=2607660 RepID=A0A5B1LFD5_9ACTN|nr:LuxR C-terminal-related transcriptional regulator [Nocardioides humilatus]KAA1419353.1 LuxR family transcriptional regulator [Nocardioides humilatus]